MKGFVSFPDWANLFWYFGLQANLYLFGAGFDIKWCHKVFDMNSPKIVLKDTPPFLCSVRVPSSNLALSERIFLVIVINVLVVCFGFLNLVGSYLHSTNTSILSVEEKKCLLRK